MPQAGSLRRALKNGVVLTLGIAAGWAFFLAVTWLFGWRGIWFEATVAAALCLMPGWLVFAIFSQYGTAAPVAVFLIAMAGRMAAVMVGALAVKSAWPDLDMKAFALFLGAFYVLSLAIETKLLLKSPADGKSTDD